MKRIAVFPGSFDPITKGHENILLRALPLFDKVIVAIGVNSSKQSFYNLEQRKKWIEEVFKKYDKVSVQSYSGLTVDFCKKVKAQYILRSLRTSSDFEFENLISQNNKVLAPEIETVFVFPETAFSAISSTVVRDIIRNGGDASMFVPKAVKLKQ
jgi:pantetheine-phosphate adenylyltransferase